MNLHKLEALLGAKQVVSENQDQAKYSWQSPYFQRLEPFRDPLPIVYVESIEQLTEVLKLASLEKWAIVPVGGGTKLKIGNPPSKADFFLSLSQMNQILEHEAADLTTTVQAGCRFGDFQSSLGKLGQHLPLNPPFTKLATVGGVVATNSYGATRLAGGTIRDWLIGIKVVTANGQVSKAGGKVVKNVAGYDLMKLYTGSFGTLCIIVEASFKLRPRPAQEAIVLGVFNFAELTPAARKLLDSQLQPNALELLNLSAAKACFPEMEIKQGQWLLVAQFAGSSQAIKHQITTTEEFWSGKAERLISIASSDNQYVGWGKIIDFAESYVSLGHFRASCLPSETVSLANEIEKGLSEASNDFALLAHVGNGIVRGFISQSELGELDDKKLGQIMAVIKDLRGICEKLGGCLVLEDDTFYNKLDVWGTPTQSTKLMKTIKEKLDPLKMLNPGRFVANI